MDQQSIDVVCLAVRAYRQRDGSPDVVELAATLNETLGPSRWLATRTWLFVEPPVVFRPGFLTVPIVCPLDALNELTASGKCASRLICIERVQDAHLRRWRWVAFQLHPGAGVHGALPWECGGCGGFVHI